MSKSSHSDTYSSNETNGSDKTHQKFEKFDDYLNFVNLVKEGYDITANDYLEQKSSYQVELSIFSQWKNNIEHGKVVELGCGAGYPVGKTLIEEDFNYIGIDISSQQIELAKENYPDYNDCFKQMEVFDYLKSLDDNSLDGIISLFTIFHIPRVYHMKLFDEILRVLRPGGHLLFNAPPSSFETRNEDWMGASMVWSSFSYEIYQKTLSELGFTLVATERDEREFLGEKETTWYLHFKVPEE